MTNNLCVVLVKFTRRLSYLLGLILILNKVAQAANGDLPTNYIGVEGKDGMSCITIYRLGVEQYSNKGERLKFRSECWDLSLNVAKNGKVEYCSLERTVFDSQKLFGFDDGTHISINRHTPDEGNLELKTVDLKKGEIDFSIKYTNDAQAEIQLRFRKDNSMYYLNEFKGVGFTRGVLSHELEGFELRVPKYGYTLNVPVAINGYYSPQQKELDELLEKLNPPDRIKWLKIKDAIFDLKDIEQRLKIALKDHADWYDKSGEFDKQKLNDLPKKDQEVVEAACRKLLIDIPNEKLEKSDISKEGKILISDYIRKKMSSFKLDD
jgi:hypothetical protein